jgi:hypothetical protein
MSIVDQKTQDLLERDGFIVVQKKPDPAAASGPVTAKESDAAVKLGFNEREIAGAKAIIRKFPGVLTWVYALQLARAAINAT